MSYCAISYVMNQYLIADIVNNVKWKIAELTFTGICDEH